MRLVCEPAPFLQVRGYLLDLVERIDEATADELKCLLQEVVPEYRPQLSQPVPAQPSGVEVLAEVNSRNYRKSATPLPHLGLQEAA